MGQFFKGTLPRCTDAHVSCQWCPASTGLVTARKMYQKIRSYMHASNSRHSLRNSTA
jgi:hypothetical protein